MHKYLQIAVPWLVPRLCFRICLLSLLYNVAHGTQLSRLGYLCWNPSYARKAACSSSSWLQICEWRPPNLVFTSTEPAYWNADSRNKTNASLNKCCGCLLYRNSWYTIPMLLYPSFNFLNKKSLILLSCCVTLVNHSNYNQGTDGVAKGKKMTATNIPLLGM